MGHFHNDPVEPRTVAELILCLSMLPSDTPVVSNYDDHPTWFELDTEHYEVPTCVLGVHICDDDKAELHDFLTTEQVEEQIVHAVAHVRRLLTPPLICQNMED